MKIIFEDDDAKVEWVLPISIRTMINNYIEKETLAVTVGMIEKVTSQLRLSMNTPQKFTQYPGQAMPDPIRAIVALLAGSMPNEIISINSILDAVD